MNFQSQTIIYSLCLFLTLVSCTHLDTNVLDKIAEDVSSIELKNKLNESSDVDRWTAFQMFDASSKFITGLANGNLLDLGNFDECYNIKYNDIYGKYCLGTISFNNTPQETFKNFEFNFTIPRRVGIEPRLMGLGAEYVGLHIARCIPSTWNVSQIPSVLFTYSEDLCYSKATEPELSDGAIATIVILSIFLCIIVLSTAIDIYFYYMDKKAPHELLIAFSILTNGRKLFKSSTDSNQLLCLNGLRAISMMWVVLGHEYSSIMYPPLMNLKDINDWEHDPANMFIMGATVSVDTFFVMGGLVTVYSYLKSVSKGVKFNIFLYYVHRYLRLTPALAIMALIHLYILNYLSNGPGWISVNEVLVKPCETGWWSTFLYITNYVQDGIAWYLMVDMQLFVLSPLILIPLSRYPKIGLGALGLLTIAGCVTPFVISYVNSLGTMAHQVGDPEDFVRLYYNQTYARFGPYVIGMIAGYFIYQVKNSQLKLKFSKFTVCGLWLFFLTGLTACLYSEYPLDTATKPDRWGYAFFTAFDRPAWGVCVAGIIFLCASGYGGFIDKFLSLPVFQFLAKLSYSIYLTHYAVIVVRYSAMKTPLKFSNLLMMHNFWGDFMISIALSLILCLSFESPIIILEKHLFGSFTVKREPRSDKPTA